MLAAILAAIGTAGLVALVILSSCALALIAGGFIRAGGGEG